MYYYMVAVVVPTLVTLLVLAGIIWACTLIPNWYISMMATVALTYCVLAFYNGWMSGVNGGVPAIYLFPLVMLSIYTSGHFHDTLRAKRLNPQAEEADDQN